MSETLAMRFHGLTKQMWACKECAEDPRRHPSVRQWGFGRPINRHFEPLLVCDHCGGYQKHVYHGSA